MPCRESLTAPLAAVILLVLVACGSPTQKETAPQLPVPSPIPQVELDVGAHLQPVAWEEVPGWASLDLLPGLKAFRNSCRVLKSKSPWVSVCKEASLHLDSDPQAVREMFEDNFIPHLATDGEKSTGRLTGYYEPLLRGSRRKTDRYRYPLYNPPGDLVDPKHPSAGKLLQNNNERGRIVNGSLVPYLTRAEIESKLDLMEKHAFLWVDSIGDRFFLHIQGSGRVLLEDGTLVRVGFANHNGHRFVSLANHLIKSKQLARSEASMEGIKAFLALNEGRAREILAVNPRYIFFRELPPSDEGPLGALGVPLIALHSIAVDRRYVPLGAPAVISTKGHDKAHTFTRLVAAQDVGGAIKGKVRADYFWGYGETAGKWAEATNQPFSAWVLLPRS